MFSAWSAAGLCECELAMSFVSSLTHSFSSYFLSIHNSSRGAWPSRQGPCPHGASDGPVRDGGGTSVILEQTRAGLTPSHGDLA